jgi:dihydroneopterin triphosphate diphosphatase
MTRAPFQVLVLPFRHYDQRAAEFAIFLRSDASYWQGIAGGGEAGETPLQAAKREAYEEAGIPFDSPYYHLHASASIPVENFAARAIWPQDLYVIPEHCFAVNVSAQTIRVSDEHTRFSWVSAETAQSMLHWHSNRVALWELAARIHDRTLIESVE